MVLSSTAAAARSAARSAPASSSSLTSFCSSRARRSKRVVASADPSPRAAAHRAALPLPPDRRLPRAPRPSPRRHASPAPSRAHAESQAERAPSALLQAAAPSLRMEPSGTSPFSAPCHLPLYWNLHTPPSPPHATPPPPHTAPAAPSRLPTQSLVPVEQRLGVHQRPLRLPHLQRAPRLAPDAVDFPAQMVPKGNPWEGGGGGEDCVRGEEAGRVLGQR